MSRQGDARPMLTSTWEDDDLGMNVERDNSVFLEKSAGLFA